MARHELLMLTHRDSDHSTYFQSPMQAHAIMSSTSSLPRYRAATLKWPSWKRSSNLLSNSSSSPSTPRLIHIS